MRAKKSSPKKPPEPAVFREYERIVEYSYLPKLKRFVVRFLNGNSYTLDTKHLPKKLQTKRPKWEEAKLSLDQSAIVLVMGKEVREIPSYVIHSKGILL